MGQWTESNHLKFWVNEMIDRRTWDTYKGSRYLERWKTGEWHQDGPVDQAQCAPTWHMLSYFLWLWIFCPWSSKHTPFPCLSSLLSQPDRKQWQLELKKRWKYCDRPANTIEKTWSDEHTIKIQSNGHTMTALLITRHHFLYAISISAMMNIIYFCLKYC